MSRHEQLEKELQEGRGHPVPREVLAEFGLLREVEDELDIAQYAFEQTDIYLGSLDVPLSGAVGVARAGFYPVAVVVFSSGGSFGSDLPWNSIESRNIMYASQAISVEQSVEVREAMAWGVGNAVSRITRLSGWSLPPMSSGGEDTVRDILEDPVAYVSWLCERREVTFAGIRERVEHLWQLYPQN